MATLATKPYLVASLNIMVAARQHDNPKEAFSNDEIAEILLMMASNYANVLRPPIEASRWQHKPTERV
jgi:hypothetical protein